MVYDPQRYDLILEKEKQLSQSDLKERHESWLESPDASHKSWQKGYVDWIKKGANFPVPEDIRPTYNIEMLDTHFPGQWRDLTQFVNRFHLNDVCIWRDDLIDRLLKEEIPISITGLNIDFQDRRDYSVEERHSYAAQLGFSVTGKKRKKISAGKVSLDEILTNPNIMVTFRIAPDAFKVEYSLFTGKHAIEPGLRISDRAYLENGNCGQELEPEDYARRQTSPSDLYLRLKIDYSENPLGIIAVLEMLKESVAPRRNMKKYCLGIEIIEQEGKLSELQDRYRSLG